MAEDKPKAYPDSGPLAVLARLAFCAAVFAIVAAVLAPIESVPKLLYSHYLEHFAAFYVATLAGLAAMPRTSIVRIGVGFSLFALALEFGHRLWDPTMYGPRENWVANTGGVAAALAPLVVDRFRRRFWPR
jgi:hypothetical protein